MKDLSPTVDNQNQYYNINYQTFPPHNDEAIIDEWAVPNLVMGTMGIYQAGRTAFELAPYAKDIWAGRNLIFHKPFPIMNNLEKQQLKENKIDFYKNFLHNNPLETSFGTVNFRNRQSGEIDTKYARQLPLLRYKISKFNKNDSIPMQDFKQRPHIKYFDNFKTKWLGKDYDYQIRHNNNDNSIDFYNIKEYELFKKDLKDPKYKRYTEE